MPQPIQLKRRIGTTGNPPTLLPGEPAYNSFDDTLMIGDGTGTVKPLVSASRQLELGVTAVPQVITAPKQIAIANLKLTGGAANNVVQTDGAGNLSFVASPPPTPATPPEMVAGTLNTVFATPLATMGLTGTAVGTLATTAKTLVPAINELKAQVDLLALGGLFVGSFDASSGAVVWTAASGQVSATALPPAAAGNRGWYLVADGAGAVPPTNAAPGTYDIGDWAVSDGTAWSRLAFGGALAAVVASAVTVTPAVNGMTNVQASLENLDTIKVDGPLTATTANIAVYSGATGKIIADGGTTIAQLQADIAAMGDVVGPAAAINNNIAVFDTTTGKLIKDGLTTIATITASIATKVDITTQDARDDAQDALIAASGDVFGPLGSLTDNIAVFSDLTGKVIADGGMSLLDIQTAANTALAGKLSLTGGTMTGAIQLLAIPPVMATEAANKKYVDDSVAAATGGLSVVTDGVSIDGTGLAAAPITLILCDGGTY